MHAIGGLIGDMVGQPYEFNNNMKTRDFLFLEKGNNIFTDDSVMTLAVANGILDAGTNADISILKDSIKKSMIRWGRTYHDVGYGTSFLNWLSSADPQPYYSWGNGSAMRVGIIPWLYGDDLEKCLAIASAQAELTHNHPEGIKGAKSIAHITWLALHCIDKDEILKTAREYYPLDEKCDSIREWYHFDVSCHGTCPVAIQCFLEGENYEDAVRLAISMGGDADTLGCITGIMAEAYYGVPFRHERLALEILPDDLKEILLKVNNVIDGRNL